MSPALPQSKKGPFAKLISVGRTAFTSFLADEALTRGAAIAFYAVTSIAPVLLIVIAIAGLFFGREAASNAIVAQLSSLMGRDSATLLQDAVNNASTPTQGLIASVVGVTTLLVTASGVFSEMQSALNVIWKTEAHAGTISRLVRARTASLGLVAALGFLLLVSLVVSTAITALADYLDRAVPFGHAIVALINVIVSYVLVAFMFAAIYKILPDRHLEWRNVILGGMITAFLFNIGKFLISFYLGTSAIGSTYGAAGSLVIILLWIYYSAQLFLLGAEFTKAHAYHYHGYRPPAVVSQTSL
jgi:membrane protein